jgi:hypothetical protein
MKAKIFISFEQAKHICDKNQYGESTFFERIKLSIRHSWCMLTRKYSKNNNKLTNIIKRGNLNCLKDNERKKLQQQFEKELSKHQ